MESFRSWIERFVRVCEKDADDGVDVNGMDDVEFESEMRRPRKVSRTATRASM